MDNIEYANCLRLIANWYEANLEVPQPHTGFQVFTARANFECIARALGSCEKVQEPDHNLFRLCRDFGSIRVEFITPLSEICTRKVVGTEAVPERVIPAFTREIVEWDCHSPLLAPSRGM